MTERKELPGGFEYVEVQNSSANAKIALNGAHLFHYERVGEKPLLWLSEISDFEEGRAIRGGVPICWPWFGMNEDKSLPQHGFARNIKWKLKETKEIDEKSTAVRLTLTHTDETLKLWPYMFELELHVVISDILVMELKTTNIDDKTFRITQALHTYFDISDILDVEIEGLDKKPYLDALTWKSERQRGVVSFSGEVDRVYQEVDTELFLKDAHRTISIKNEGSSSAVVWNPWIDKCKRMSAMRDDDYLKMVCIESANAFDDTREIKPGESHTLKATIS